MPIPKSVMPGTLSMRAQRTDSIHASKRMLSPQRPLKSATGGGAAIAERLESRDLLSVSLGSDGFTTVTAPDGAKTVYVSSSLGNDANDGSTSAAAVKTLARGAALMRDGTGDQLLLKRGDTWRESFGFWWKGGASADSPLVIGAYGSGVRPTVATGTNMGISFGTASHPNVSHVALMGIRFYADSRDPSSPTFAGSAGTEGIRVTSTANDVLIEDCASQFYTCGINLYDVNAPMTNIRVRRCMLTDAYATTGHAQGLFAYGVNGLTLEENVLDHNGWNNLVAGAQATIFNHDAYITETVTNFVARGNLFSNASNFGLQARSGGIIENNVFLNDPVGMSFGLVNGSTVLAGGITGVVRNNVFLSNNILTSNPPGWGITIGNTKPGGGTLITGNVFAQSSTTAGFAIMFQYGTSVTNPQQEVGINDLTVENNVVYKWARGIQMMQGYVPGGKGQKALNDLTVRNNDFQQLGTRTAVMVTTDPSATHFSGNTYDSAAGAPIVAAANGATINFSTWSSTIDIGAKIEQVTYSDPDRTAGTYAMSLGLGSSDAAFVSAARGQTAANWNPAYTGKSLAAYVLSGFGISTADSGSLVGGGLVGVGDAPTIRIPDMLGDMPSGRGDWS